MSSYGVVNSTKINIGPNTNKFYLLCHTTCVDLSHAIIMFTSGIQNLLKKKKYIYTGPG